MGKSCISSQATRHKFETNHVATIGFEYFTFNIRLNETVIKLQIWDTCGQEFYKSLISSFYRNTSLAVIVYAIDDQKSFDDLDMWLKDLRSNSSPDIKIFLIGNKIDLEDERVIPKEKAEKFKNDYELDFFMETSAKSAINTQELFVKAAQVLNEDFIEYKKNKKNKTEKNEEEEGTVKLNEKNKDKKKGGCC